MTQEKTLGDESCQCCLVDWRRVLIHCTADLDQRIDEWPWRNDIAQPQRGTKNLADRSRVNYVIGVIHPLQRREGWPDKAEFRVVVVLENKGVVSTRKIEQGGPTLEAHRNAERKLMGGRYINDLRQWFLCGSRNHDSVVVERLGNCSYAG